MYSAKNILLSLALTLVSCGPTNTSGSKTADAGTQNDGAPPPIDALPRIGSATYYGIEGNENSHAMYVAPNGEIVAGTFVNTSGYQGTTNGTQPQFVGGQGGDYLIARFSEDLSRIENATYFGGSTREILRTITHGRDDGSPIVANWSGGGWPTTAGAAFTTHSGADDFAVARISPNLTSTIGASYWGGTADEQLGGACTSPANGDIYLVGEHLLGADPTFAVPGHDQTKGGGTDAIALRFNADLTSLLSATLKGLGSEANSGRSGEPGEEAFAGCIVEPSGDAVFIFGRPRGTLGDKSLATAGAYQTIPANTNDPVICKYNAQLTQELACTHLGISNPHSTFSQYWKPNAMLVHPNGDLYVVQTLNAGVDWIHPTSGAYSEVRGGGQDIAITRFSADLSQVVASTFIGDAGDETASEITLRADGNIIIGGSSTGPFPTTSNALYPNASGAGQEGILFVMNPELTDITDATYFGPGSTNVRHVAIHPNGFLYVAGTGVDGLPATDNGAQPIYGGGTSDMYIARISPFLDAVDID